MLAKVCRDTCVISLSGMATTMRFLQMVNFILTLKNKAPKVSVSIHNEKCLVAKLNTLQATAQLEITLLNLIKLHF